MESNVGIHLFEHISTSAVEWGLRDHFKPFHYEGFPLGDEGIFLFLIFFPFPADMLSDQAIARSWMVCSFNQNCHCWILQLDLEWAPSESPCMLLEQNGATVWGEKVGTDWLFAGGDRMLVFPLSWWMGLNHHNKVLQGCFTICGCSLTAHENTHYCCFHVLTISLRSLGMHLSSPTLFFPFIWFWDKRSLNLPCFFSLSMACVTIFCHLIQGM